MQIIELKIDDNYIDSVLKSFKKFERGYDKRDSHQNS